MLLPRRVCRVKAFFVFCLLILAEICGVGCKQLFGPVGNRLQLSGKEGKLSYLDVVDFDVRIRKQLIYHKNKWVSKSFSALLEYIKVMEFGQRGRDPSKK